MKVKIFSEDSTNVFFHSITDSLNKKIDVWLEDSKKEIISATTSVSSIKKDDVDETIMTCTIIYK